MSKDPWTWIEEEHLDNFPRFRSVCKYCGSVGVSWTKRAAGNSRKAHERRSCIPRDQRSEAHA